VTTLESVLLTQTVIVMFCPVATRTGPIKALTSRPLGALELTRA
jgi:hypothetical protein